MSRTGSAPTMKDVAREAGVALGTVSKVINGIPVGENYRLRVEEAIAKLNYRVNSYAKGLKSNRTYVIAVMVPNLISPFFAGLSNAIHDALTRQGYRMLLCATNYDPEREQACVIMAEQQQVDGIICLSYNPELQVSEGVPLISIDRYFGRQIPCVSSDNFGGGALAARKLTELGCKHLAMLCTGSRQTKEPDKRRSGFTSECENLGVPFTVKMLDEGTPYSGFEGFLQDHFGGGKRDFDGIFCGADVLAHQVIRFLQSMGVRIPEEVQVIGFDGIRHFGDREYICSTIVQPLERIAQVSVNMVLEKDRTNSPALVCLPVSYAPGGTTKDKTGGIIHD